MSTTPILSNNELAFLALANEYCAAVEAAPQGIEPHDFAGNMLRLLPRLYISAADLRRDDTAMADEYITNALEEDHYEALRQAMAAVMGEDDAYLEVFEEDMKYSDTPIGASISEGLADLFQVMYNIVQTAREATPEDIAEMMPAIHTDFADYWSGTLCNVLRALNKVYYRYDS